MRMDGLELSVLFFIEKNYIYLLLQVSFKGVENKEEKVFRISTQLNTWARLK